MDWGVRKHPQPCCNIVIPLQQPWGLFGCFCCFSFYLLGYCGFHKYSSLKAINYYCLLLTVHLLSCFLIGSALPCLPVRNIAHGALASAKKEDVIYITWTHASWCHCVEYNVTCWPLLANRQQLESEPLERMLPNMMLWCVPMDSLTVADVFGLESKGHRHLLNHAGPGQGWWDGFNVW